MSKTKNSKTTEENPYLKAHDKATKTLTQLTNEIRLLTTNPKGKMDKDTYTFKVNKLTNKWNHELGYINNEGRPTRDLNFLVQDLEKKIAENKTALGSRYTLIPGTNTMALYGYNALGSIQGSSTPLLNNLKIDQKKFSNESGRDYIINPHYIDRFNPKGSAATEEAKEKAAVDEFGRDYDHPNFGIHPNRLNLSIKDGE